MNVTRLEYFRYALKQEFYRDRQWCLRCFTVPSKDKSGTEVIPAVEDGKVKVWMEVEGNGEWYTLSDHAPGELIFPLKTRFELTPDDMQCVKNPLETNYGEAVLNAILFEYSTQGALPFIPGKLKGKTISIAVAVALENDIITVDQYLKVMQGMNFMTLFADIVVSAYSPKALQASPEALRIRDELLAKFADQLNDPTIVAMIDEAVTEADKEFMKGDPAAKFYLKDKAYAVIRKKLFHVQGGLTKLDDPTKMDYIPRALDDGYAPEDLPAIINASRSGSYDRGASTALGGEAAKFSNRVFQNLKIAEDDCGTVIGKPELVSKTRDLVGRYIVGQTEPITQQQYTSLIGKRIYLRDPTACKTPNRAFCGKCLGDKEVQAETGLGPRMAEMCNVFMSISLAAFHGNISRTVVFDPFVDIM